MRHMISVLWITAALAGCGGGNAAQNVNIGADSTPSETTPPIAPATVPPPPTRVEDRLDRSSDIFGPDADADGVRDDINAWINTQAFTEQQQKAVMEKARALQQTLLLNSSDKNAARVLAERNFAATDCITAAYESKSKQPRQLTSQLEAMTANTRERARQYIQYNAALGGMAFDMSVKPACD